MAGSTGSSNKFVARNDKSIFSRVRIIRSPDLSDKETVAEFKDECFTDRRYTFSVKRRCESSPSYRINISPTLAVFSSKPLASILGRIRGASRFTNRNSRLYFTLAKKILLNLLLNISFEST